ncbi:MAG TPA: hypothetical protein VMC84_03050 [Methanocella sp.]|uniref:hypothetical protein n=1 Tax=Methanocella sp. TaxID=2052833 RepID=UPI002C879C8B|nr:hypothetical protein [Methanocella sp.]HTY90131.1 hypothetical protein [Methanocella sp.]
MDRRIIIIASALIAVLAIFASGAGMFMNGLYKNDTKSGAAQEQGNDLVTLVLCVPLLVVSTYFAAKGSLRGRLIWTGIVFYFLYTYAMMSFMTAYNRLFLVYVAIYSLSLYAFGASLLTLDVNVVGQSLANAPVRAAAVFMFLMSLMLTAMWLGTIVPPLMAGEKPALLETYTTMVIQAMDLGILVPLGLITGYLLLRRNAWGYALASIVLIKAATYGTAVLAMALFQVLNGIEVFVPFALALIVLVLAAIGLNVMFYGKMKAPATTGAV